MSDVAVISLFTMILVFQSCAACNHLDNIDEHLSKIEKQLIHSGSTEGEKE